MVIELKKAAPRFVYLVRSHGLYKIGRTADLNKRLSTLRSSSPCDIELIYSIESMDASNIESRLHQLYKNQNHHGEWFAFSSDVSGVKEQMRRQAGKPVPTARINWDPVV